MKSILFLLTILISFQGFTQVERKYIRQGNKRYNNEKYDEAELQYRKALEKSPDSKKADYNLANTLYKQEKFEAAGTKYLDLAGKEKDKNELARYYYNLGNSLFKDNNFGKSIEAYKNSLKNRPDDMDAKHNLQLAKSMLKMQQQQQQQQQKQEQQEQEQQEQQQQEQQQQQQQQQPAKQEEISKEDAERLLDALEREEDNVMKKLQKQVRQVPVDKNW